MDGVMIWLSRCSLLAYLGAAAFLDVKEKTLPLLYAVSGVAAGVVFWPLAGQLRGYELAGGILLGGMLLLIAYLSRQQFGYGDGIVFVATGTFLGGAANVALLFFSLVFTGVFFLLCKGRKNHSRQQTVAFLPFVLAGYDLVLLLF